MGMTSADPDWGRFDSGRHNPIHCCVAFAPASGAFFRLSLENPMEICLVLAFLAGVSLVLAMVVLPFIE